MLLEKVLCLLPNVPEIKEKQKKCLNLLLTALFINTRILKFKSQMAFAFFAAVNHLSGPRSSLNFIRLRRVVIIECFHSRGQHLCKFIGTKESVCIRKEFNSHRTGLGHQHGRRFIVLEHQYGRRDVMRKHSNNDSK